MRGERANKTALNWILGIGLAFLAFGGWMHRRHEVPDVHITAAGLPIPNAYDTWTAAYNAYVHPPTPGVDIIDDPAGVSKLVNGHVIVVTKYAPSRREAWLSRNAACLALVRRGLGQRYDEPDSFLSENFTFYAHARELARLLAIESHALAIRGDWNGATDAALDIVSMGRNIGSGSAVVGEMVGCAFGAIGAYELRKTLPHLDAAGAARALARMKLLEAGTVPLSRTLIRQKRLDLLMLVNAMKRGELIMPELLSEDDKAAITRSRWNFANNARIVADCSKLLDQYIALADSPYISLKLPPAPPRSLADPVVANYFALDKGVFFNGARDRAQQQLLMQSIALKLYKAKTGAYPASLAALAPAYLASLPADPFGTGAPYRYRRQGSGYLLYSVGPDGRDDGGSPLVNKGFPVLSPPDRLIMPGSAGDAVAPLY